MADWSSSGPLSILSHGLEWSSSGPVAEKPGGVEWYPTPGRAVGDRLAMIDRSIAVPSLILPDRIGAIDRADASIPTAFVARQILAAVDRAGVRAGVGQRELCSAIDRARVSFPIRDILAALDRASVAGGFGVRDKVGLVERVNMAAALTQRDILLMKDRATAEVAYSAPVTVEVTAQGTTNVLIPPQFRYIDAVGVACGGGGASGNQALADGKAGEPGNWLALTWDRGPGRNAWVTITVTIGAPGTGGAVNQQQPGAKGGDITVAIPVAGLSTTATGGAGGSGTNGVGQTLYLGKGPGNQVWEGITYVGGGQAAKSQNGLAPGGAGAGGSGAGWPFNGQPGGIGGAAKVWIRFWM